MCRESLSAHSHAGPAAGNPPGSRLRPCTAVACCSRSSSSVAQQPRAMTASKREQAKGEARMRCSGSRAGNGCEPRMRRTWWPRPPAGLWGAGESGSQCIGGGVMLGRQNSHPAVPALSRRCCGANDITADVMWPSPGEARVEIRSRQKNHSDQSQSLIANCQLPNGQTAAHLGVAGSQSLPGDAASPLPEGV